MALKNKTENVVCDNCTGSGGPVQKASPRGETMRSDCNKIGTWNVLSLNMPGKLANVLKEMKRTGVRIMGVEETFWDKEGSFPTQLPESEGGDKYHVFYSGGKRKRRGVGVIVREEVVKSVMMWEPISERITIMKLKVAPINMLIVQIYAPCEDDKEEEKDRFYETLDQIIAEYRKGRECVVVMGDFNGKVGDSKVDDTVGPFGLGERNDNGERVVGFCKSHNLFATNTWFQQKRSAQWTWKSPGEEDPVKNIRKPEIRDVYRMQLDRKLQEEKIDGGMEIDEIWKKLKDDIVMVAEEICGKEQRPMRQSWMNSEILNKMEERTKCKIMKEEEKYKKLKHEVQKLCREAKDKYYEDKCKEIEMLDKVYSQLLYQKIKELRPKGNRMLQTIKSKQGKSLLEKDEVMERG